MDAQDKFKQKVYDWEDHILHPAFDIPVTSPDTARKIIRRISREMEIPCPKLVCRKTHLILNMMTQPTSLISATANSCRCCMNWRTRTHSIKLDEANNENAMHHSPGFVWHAIDLYHRYAGISLDYLVHTATAAGISRPPSSYRGRSIISAMLRQDLPCGVPHPARFCTHKPKSIKESLKTTANTAIVAILSSRAKPGDLTGFNTQDPPASLGMTVY